MPTVFRHSLVAQVGTTPTDVLQIGPGVRATVIGCNLANTTEFDTVVADVSVVGSTTVFYAKGLVIPPNTTVKLVTQGEKLILPENTSLRVVCDTDDSIDSVVSFVEIS